MLPDYNSISGGGCQANEEMKLGMVFASKDSKKPQWRWGDGEVPAWVVAMWGVCTVYDPLA